MQIVHERTEAPVNYDDSFSEDGDWWTLKTPKDFCYFHRSNLIHDNDGTIIVWPAKDDPILLRIAAKAHEEESPVLVVEYEISMGKCISYYKWIQE